MKIYKINDVKSLDFFKFFLEQNPVEGSLKIRAYTASEAMPVKNLAIKVSKVIDDKIVVFYEGKTNESGIIENIKLPAPRISFNDEEEPKSTNYNVTASYMGKDYYKYVISIYENVLVIQNINIVLGENNVY